MDTKIVEAMSEEEQEIARLLQAAGPRAAMPDELKACWEHQFSKELRPVLQQRRRNRNALMGIAASVVAVGLVTLLSWQAPDTVPLSAQVVRISGDSQLTSSGDSSQSLQVGQSLSLDDTISIGNTSFAAVSYQGYDLRLKSGSRVQLVPEGIALEWGEIYISNEAGRTNNEGITVLTPFGSTEDIGTQFTVSVNHNGATSTVRRGAIVVTTEAEKIRAEAGTVNAREISIDSAHLVQLSDSAATGPDWEWIYHSTPGFALEGQTVAAFLQWSSRESGMRVEYSSESARIYASTEILRGDIMDLNPDEAVETVLATTRLLVQRNALNTLQLSLRPRH